MASTSLQRASRTGRRLCLVCWASFALFLAASQPVRLFLEELARLVRIVLGG